MFFRNLNDRKSQRVFVSNFDDVYSLVKLIKIGFKQW